MTSPSHLELWVLEVNHVSSFGSESNFLWPYLLSPTSYGRGTLYYKEVLKYSDIYINNFVGHTDATETTKNKVKVTQVFLWCRVYIFTHHADN